MCNEQWVSLNLYQLVVPVFPCCARTMARLAAMVDFPSAGSGEVTTIDFISLSTEENGIFVLICRYCSEMGNFGLL